MLSNVDKLVLHIITHRQEYHVIDPGTAWQIVMHGAYYLTAFIIVQREAFLVTLSSDSCRSSKTHVVTPMVAVILDWIAFL